MAGNDKGKSHVGFFVALLLIVAAGGAAYLYFNATELAPIEQQQATEAVNQPIGHPPKKVADAVEPASPANAEQGR
jgi:hypothetical protein